jgi:hypothetical protein
MPDPPLTGVGDWRYRARPSSLRTAGSGIGVERRRCSWDRRGNESVLHVLELEQGTREYGLVC